MRGVRMLLVAGLVGSFVATGCGGGGGSQGSSGTGSGASGSSDGARLVSTRCTQCHSLDRIQSARRDRGTWESTVSRMEGHGLQLSSQEKSAVVEYLAKTYGPQ